MSPSQLLPLLLLLLPLIAEATIQCLISPAAEFGRTRHPAPGQCYQNWCKRAVGGSGVVEYSCDETGDCARNANNDPYDPYTTQISNCWRRNGREICCCNMDYCNSSPSKALLQSILGLILLLLDR